MSFFDELNIAEFVQQKIQEIIPTIKKTNLRWNFRCPICGDSKKSKRKMRGNYYIKTNSYYCFNEQCCASGLDIIAQFENRDISDVKREYLEYIKDDISKTNQTPQPTLKPSLIEKPKEQLLEMPQSWSTLPLNVVRYLNKRKILKAPFLDKKYQFYYDLNSERLVIPWFRLGKLRCWQTRALLKTQYPKYVFNDDGEKDLFNFDKIDQNKKYVFLLEGVFDAIFIPNSVAIGSTTLTDNQKALLESCNCEPVWMLDNQHVDESAYKRLKKILSTTTDKVFLWPKKSQKDVNDIVINDEKYVNTFRDYDWLVQHIHSGAKGLLKLTYGENKQ